MKRPWLVRNYGHEMSGVQRQIDSVRGNARQVEHGCAFGQGRAARMRAFSALKESVRSLERKPLPVNIFVVLKFSASCTLPTVVTRNKKHGKFWAHLNSFPPKSSQ